MRRRQVGLGFRIAAAMAFVGLGPVFDAIASMPIFSVRAGYASRPVRSKRPQASRPKKANRNHISRRTRRKHRRSK